MSAATALIENIETVKKTGFFTNIDDLRNSGLLKGFEASHAKYIKSLYATGFITEIAYIQDNIYKAIKANAFLSNSKLSDKEIDKIRQFIMTRILHKAVANRLGRMGLSEEDYKSALLGMNSIPREFHKFSKNKTSILYEFLYSRIGDTTKDIDMLKVQGKKIDPATANRLAEAFDKLPTAVWEQILLVAAMQTGYNYSPINFLKHFNSTKIAEILKPIISEIKNSDYSIFGSVDEFIADFLIANRKVTKLVPKVGEYAGITSKENGDVLVIPASHSAYGKRIVRKSERVKSVKNGKEDSEFIDIVYKLEAVDTKEALYIKVNPKSSYFLQESHKGNTSIDSKIVHPKNTITVERRATLLSTYGKMKPSEMPVMESTTSKEQRIEDMKKWQEQNCKG